MRPASGAEWPANRVLERCSSTNDYLKELAERGAPAGTWISCRLQDSGRGRHGRVWDSLAGNLFLSILFRPSSERWVSWLPLAVAVGTARVILARFPSVDLAIKWPNDLWIDSRKLAGILCEARPTGRIGEFFVVAGLGLNCARAPEGAVSLSEALGREVLAEEIREAVLTEVMRVTEQLFVSGPELIKAEYNIRALFKAGMKVQWSGGAHSGTVIGLGPSSELLVSIGNDVKSLFAEEVFAARLV